MLLIYAVCVCDFIYSLKDTSRVLRFAGRSYSLAMSCKQLILDVRYSAQDSV